MAAPHEPERTCVGCRGKAPKRDLVRIVRSPSRVIAADPTGTAAGRGAYVHRDPACVAAAFGRGALARALRASPGADELARLRAEIERLPR